MTDKELDDILTDFWLEIDDGNMKKILKNLSFILFIITHGIFIICAIYFDKDWLRANRAIFLIPMVITGMSEVIIQSDSNA